jgi:hypothetical protein
MLLVAAAGVERNMMGIIRPGWWLGGGERGAESFGKRDCEAVGASADWA